MINHYLESGEQIPVEQPTERIVEISDLRKPSVELIVWEDCGFLSGWNEIPTVIELADNPKLIYSIGFVVYETDRVVVLAASWEEQFGKTCEVTFIPKRQIDTRNEIEVWGGLAAIKAMEGKQ